MGLTLTTPPTETPLSLAEAKLFLRVDSTDEDSFITGLIQAATEKAEHDTQRQFVTAGYRFTTNANGWWWIGMGGMSGWPFNASYVDLPLPPLVAVSSIVATDVVGNTSSISSSTYYIVGDTTPARVVFTTTPAFDNTRENGLAINFTCGYGAASAVPFGLKQAMYQMISNWYRCREDGEYPSDSAIDRQLQIYRAFNVGN